ncbi:hypothetical protein DM02DRAFT_405907 [Periconia macrospinosa]|uniref:Uncharacterized protein n=1 Tax=Periconia macrospinosa TaxID=97972 RepID=A0A2V1E967_9PLEO|nr:hypothetical protein DM02DRAFT_405907 [Periconia macrospinosa]
METLFIVADIILVSGSSIAVGMSYDNTGCRLQEYYVGIQSASYDRHNICRNVDCVHSSIHFCSVSGILQATK